MAVCMVTGEKTVNEYTVTNFVAMSCLRRVEGSVGRKLERAVLRLQVGTVTDECSLMIECVQTPHATANSQALRFDLNHVQHRLFAQRGIIRIAGDQFCRGLV
jgi:hypothetical protein